jgi:hypothetical protein
MVMRFVDTSNGGGAGKCLSCKPENQAEFTAEINIHFRGLKDIDHPGILFFPKVGVCLVCGFSKFTTPATELALLARGIAA